MDEQNWKFQAEPSLEDILAEFSDLPEKKQPEPEPHFDKFVDNHPEPEAEDEAARFQEFRPHREAEPAQAFDSLDLDELLKEARAAPAETNDAVPDEDAAPRQETENKGFLSGLFGKRPARRTKDAPPAEEAEDEEENEETAAPAPRAEEARAPRGGAIGQMEQEARDYIAQVQAETGVRRRRERTAEDYSYDLDDLLAIPPEEEHTRKKPLEPEAALSAATERGYDANLDYERDDSLGYTADPTAQETPAPAYRPHRDEEIDRRFKLSEDTRHGAISYGGSAVDLSPEEDYSPAQSGEYNPSQWTPEYDDPLAERHEEEAPARKKNKFIPERLRRQLLRARDRQEENEGGAHEAPKEERRKVRITGFDDSEIQPARYAEEPEEPALADEDEQPETRGDRSYKDSELYVPPTFREYLLSLFASVWLRIRGTVRGDTAETMNESEEDLGPELSPLDASKYYGSFLRSYKLRTRICWVLLAVLLYVSLEAPVPGMLQSLPTMAAFVFGLQAAILLLSLDVVTNGALNLARLRPGADSLCLLACLFSSFDALLVALSSSARLHMPLCAISAASMACLLAASYFNARGLRKAIRVPAIGKRFYAVTGEEKRRPGEISLLKSLRSAAGFVRRSEEASPDEALYARISFPLLGLALLLSLLTALFKRSFGDILYILSAMLALTVPFGALLAFALPFFLGSNRLFRFGAAVAGWSGLCDIGASRNLIVTDRDLFPPSAVSIESVRIFADEDAVKVISYAGSMMQEAGVCSAGSFTELMEEVGAQPVEIHGFEVLPGGGMKGIIDRQVVLCGSTDLMRLMNVRIPFRLTDKTTVLLAIDGVLYGIFSLKYEGQPQVRRALVDLMRTDHPPVFAVRDFNVNPEMLHTTFDLATDGYDFPPYVERFQMSVPDEEAGRERIAAILCNEGLGPLTSVVDIGRSMYLAVRANVIVNLLATLLGMLLVFVRFLSVGAFPLSSFFLYLLVWLLPVLALSGYVAVKK